MTLLVEMDVGGETYYFSNEEAEVDDQYYQPRLLSTPPITSSIGSPHAPRQHNPRATLLFDDTDDWPAAERFLTLAENNNNLVNAEFRLYEGEGTTKADFSLIYTGNVNVPGGLNFSRGRCQIQLAKALHRRNRGVPGVQLGHSFGMANAALYRPRVFGNYTRSPEQFLPTLDLGGGQFYIADPNDITSIGTVKDGDGNTISTYTDNGDGSITISPAPDEVFVSVVGASDVDYGDRGSGMAAWLIKDVIGEPAASIDTTSFRAMDADTDDVRARAYFGGQTPREQTEAVDALIRVMGDLFYDLVITPDGNYKAIRRGVTTAAIARTIEETDLRPRSGRVDYDYRADPDKVLANRLTVRYAPDPATGTYTETYTQDDHQSQTDHGEVFLRQIDTPYFYEVSGAGNLADLWLYVFGRDIYQFTTQLEDVDELQPGDELLVNLDQFTDLPIQVRGVEWDLGRRFTELQGFRLIRLEFREWAPDGLTGDFSTATDDQKAQYLFWTDSNGDDSESKYAPGGAYTLAYMTITNVAANEFAEASVINQIIENIEALREGQFTIPYGAADDYVGVAFLRDSDGNGFIAWQDNTEPQSITLDSADQLLQAGSTSGPSF